MGTVAKILTAATATAVTAALVLWRRRRLGDQSGDHDVVWAHMEELWERQMAELHKRIDKLGPSEPSSS